MAEIQAAALCGQVKSIAPDGTWRIATFAIGDNIHLRAGEYVDWLVCDRPLLVLREDDLPVLVMPTASRRQFLPGELVPAQLKFRGVSDG